MSFEIIPCVQGDPDWFKARMGIPTASEFSTVLARGKDGGASKTRRSYLFKLAGEIVCGEPMEAYQNAFMERGKLMEAEARSWYGFVTDAPMTQVGFIRNGNRGASPDALVGNDGLLEIKTASPHLLIDYLLKDEFPPEHLAQCQGGLLIAEREWLDIVIYWPSMPKLKKRLYRNEPYIATLSAAIDQFNSELAEIVAKIRARA